MPRPTPHLLATASSIGAQNSASAAGLIKRVPPALLPPIPLYRRILRTHRKHLPKEMRLLGDEYVKAEFRAHQKIDNPVHIVGFLTEWQSYAQQIEGEMWRGERMDRGKVEKMSDEQIAQMYELMQAIRKQELEDNDPEYIPHQPPALPEPKK
ncbi:Succinate dehydrogenase assembly factor 3 [Cercospora zeina]